MSHAWINVRLKKLALDFCHSPSTHWTLIWWNCSKRRHQTCTVSGMLENAGRIPDYLWSLLMEDTIFSQAARGSMNFGHFPSTMCLRAVTRYLLSGLSLLKAIHNLNASTFFIKMDEDPLLVKCDRSWAPSLIILKTNKLSERSFYLAGKSTVRVFIYACLAYTHQISKCWNYVNKPTHVFVIPWWIFRILVLKFP